MTAEISETDAKIYFYLHIATESLKKGQPEIAISKTSPGEIPLSSNVRLLAVLDGPWPEIFVKTVHAAVEAAYKMGFEDGRQDELVSSGNSPYFKRRDSLTDDLFERIKILGDQAEGVHLGPIVDDFKID